MKKIAIVSCDKWINRIKEDQLLVFHLNQEGCDAEIISWENPFNSYSDYSAMIVRSVWGYQDNYSEFKAWLENIKNIGIPLFNNQDIIMNNIRKNKQFEILKKNKIPLIDTEFIYNVDDLDQYINSNSKKVIKPIISGSGENTFIVGNGKIPINPSLEEIKKIYSEVLSEKDNGIMIQPYIEEIQNGEFACVYIDGVNTHNMLRFPGVLSRKDKPKFVPHLPESVQQLATTVSELEEYKDYLYMRVDIVMKDNNPVIMEVELADPDLLFKYIPDEKLKQNSMHHFSKQLIKKMEK